MATKRIEKINEKLKKEISKYLSENLDREGIVTVKAVETSRDLKNATVWMGLLGLSEEDFFAKIKTIRRDLQHFIASVMQTKNIPMISFCIDHSGEYAAHIEKLLKETKNENHTG